VVNLFSDVVLCDIILFIKFRCLFVDKDVVYYFLVLIVVERVRIMV